MKQMIMTGSCLDSVEKIWRIFVLEHTTVIIEVKAQMEVTF